MREKLQIIIVDDEPFSADAFGDLLRDAFPEAAIRVAYGAQAVLTMLEEAPADILISDIQMPGMTGLKLAETLHRRGHEPYILFLTGHDDFAFAYEAYKQNAVDYLLKTEGDARILAAVQKAMDRIDGQAAIRRQIDLAQQQVTVMTPAYRRQLLEMALLGGEPSGDEPEDVDVLLQARTFHLVVARRTTRGGSFPARQRMVALGAVRGLLERALEGRPAWIEALLLGTDLVWIIAQEDEANTAPVLFRLAAEAREQLEAKLDLPLFFVVGDGPSSWGGIEEQYALIQTMLAQGIARGQSGAAIRHALPAQTVLDAETIHRLHSLRQQLEASLRDIGAGSFDQLRRHSAPVLAFLRDTPPALDSYAAEFDLALRAALVAFINRNKLDAPLQEALRQIGHSPSDAEAILTLIARLEAASGAQVDTTLHGVAQGAADYIHHHLEENLSTAALADHIGYSAGYLSRVFKQQMGVNLQEYVTDARMKLAQEMLSNTALRVYEVARHCGYDNTTYFIKVFKGHTGLTPQEFKQSRRPT